MNHQWHFGKINTIKKNVIYFVLEIYTDKAGTMLNIVCSLGQDHDMNLQMVDTKISIQNLSIDIACVVQMLYEGVAPCRLWV